LVNHWWNMHSIYLSLSHLIVLEFERDNTKNVKML
jgi:hypothetical protein